MRFFVILLVAVALQSAPSRRIAPTPITSKAVRSKSISSRPIALSQSRSTVRKAPPVRRAPAMKTGTPIRPTYIRRRK